MIQKYTIGRDPSNNIVVNHPTVSGYHADIIVDDSMGYPQYSFVDHSTNGTVINGQLLKNASCYVVFNDMIVLAGTVLFDWSVLGQANYAVPHQATAVYTPGVKQSQPSADRGDPYGSSVVGRRNVTFGGALKSFFQKYVDFSTRATRQEYWYMVLWFIIFATGFSIITSLLVLATAGSVALDLEDGLVGLFSSLGWVAILWGVYNLAVLLPSLALMVRRIHDTGKSGFWLLMVLVPIANIVFFFIWTLTPSEPRTNKWGRY